MLAAFWRRTNIFGSSEKVLPWRLDDGEEASQHKDTFSTLKPMCIYYVYAWIIKHPVCLSTFFIIIYNHHYSDTSSLQTAIHRAARELWVLGHPKLPNGQDNDQGNGPPSGQGHSCAVLAVRGFSSAFIHISICICNIWYNIYIYIYLCIIYIPCMYMYNTRTYIHEYIITSIYV